MARLPHEGEEVLKRNTGLPKNAEEFVYRAVVAGELEVDRQGRLWRLGRRVWDRSIAGTRFLPCKRRRAGNFAGDYVTISLEIEGTKLVTGVHRLVWRHFRGPLPPGLTINHKNGNKKDNRLSNLELATSSEQLRHACRVLGYDAAKNVRGKQLGKDNGRAKLSKRAVTEIRASKDYCRVLAVRYGVSLCAISKIRTGRTWQSVA